MNQTESPIPSHIPSHLVKKVDYVDGDGMRKDPFLAGARLHAEGLPVFWNPCNNRHDGRGSWDVIKGEYMREVMGAPEVFSSAHCAGFSLMVGDSWLLTPLEIDPPNHAKYRSALNPLFSPPAVAKLANRIAEQAETLIKAVVDQGGCEFMEAFGRPFPVTIVMELIGLPLEDLSIFLDWEFKLLHSGDPAVQVGAAVAFRDYLKDLIIRKRVNPSDDFVSYVVNVEVEGRKLNDDEVMGICYLMVVGGLDTVASSLGFHYHYLATHLDQQKLLREQPAKIPTAVEELLRRFSVVTTSRHVLKDINFHGVEMKAGDWVSIPMPLASVDPDEIENPLEVDFNRRSRHMGFSFGPHFCMGNHIARKELNIALEKWTTMVPEFSLRPNAHFEVHGGGVYGVEHLELQW